MKTVPINIKEQIQNVRDDRDIYPKRGVSTEEVIWLKINELYEFIYNVCECDQTVINKLEQDRGVLMSLIKDINIEYYENKDN